MNWLEAKDEYCERLGPGLLAEPANALSNLAFLVSAVLLWRLLSRRAAPAPQWPLRVLVLLLFGIGLGSTAYHTAAVTWAGLLDVLFIAVFIDFYIVCFFRLLLRWPWWAAAMAIPAFHLFGWALTAGFSAGAFNGSVSYFPALAGIVLMGTTLAALRSQSAGWFFAATAVFTISLTLRSVDAAWCTWFPLGTHWAWHLLNAVTLTLVMMAPINAIAPRTGRVGGSR